jgi:hypothetical protein
VLQPTTTLAPPVWVRVLVWLGLPAAGAGLVLLIVQVTGWVPLAGPFVVVRALPGSVTLYGALGVGAILGLVLAGLVDRESLTIRIDADEVVLTRPGTTRRVPRGDVALAFTERDRLVLLGRTGRELAREPCHLSATRLRAGFAERGIAWADQDPYATAYHRWVPDLPEVSGTANALLVARQKALDSGDEDDARDLRDELGRLGYVVRDEGKKQYWRQADG